MPRSILPSLLLLAALAPVAAKDGVSMLTPTEAEALKATLSKTPDVPPELLQASDEELWDYVPPASLRRAAFLGPTEVGCPIHGKELFRVGGGFYPWKYSGDKPWQVQCPVGGETYPSNDFGAYLKSGMQDKSLLTGDYPDDGEGWVDDKGNRFFFVGYWVFHQRWYDVLKGITGFTNAYFASGDEQYAHKAAVLFCALAEQYPKMDYGKQGTQGQDGGMILPWCWENQSVVTPMSTAYDRLFPYLKTDGDQALRELVQGKTGRGPREQIEQGFMQTVARTELTTDNYWSNECDHQLAFADWALAWDNNDPADGITSRQAIDWIINDGGDNSLEELLYNSTYRDGFPCEGAIGYSMAIAERQLEIAQRLKRCGYDLFSEFPRLRQVAGCWIDMSLADGHTPSIGDAGSVLGSGRPWNARMFHLAWEQYRDPRFAQALSLLKSTRYAAYTPDRTAEFEAAVLEHGAELNHKTRNLGGMGLAILESGGPRSPRGVALYYGSPAGGHSHHDRLNIEFFDHRQSMMPDLGYPEYATSWPQRNYFTNNTISHNTVIVDQLPQAVNWVGHPELFCQFANFGAVRVDSREVYAGVQRYQRTAAFVRVGEGQGYVVDFFRIKGGKDHLYVLHGPPGEVTTEGLELTAQEGGSYAGADVAFRTQTPKGAGYGYSWITNVERDPSPGSAFAVDWKAQESYRGVTAEDDIHLRYHCLTEVADVALGDGEPPQNKPGNPRWLRYLLAHRSGEELQSTFAGVIEPYSVDPVVASAERLAITGAPEDAQAAAVRITLADGTVDYIVSSADDEAVVSSEGGPTFSGGIGWLRVREGQVVSAALCRGAKLELGGFSLALDGPGFRGHVVRMDKDMEGKGYVWVDCALPVGDTLKGQQMIIDNDRARNACYTIESVEADGDLWKVCLGDVCFVRGFADPKDYSAGYVYNFAEGAGFIIPHSVHVTRQSEHTYAVQAASEVEVGLPR